MAAHDPVLARHLLPERENEHRRMSFDVEAVVSVARRCVEVSEVATTYVDGPPWTAAEELRTPPAALDQFVAVLREQSDLAIFDDKMQQLGIIARHVDLPQLARWLIRRAMDVGPQEAIAGLTRYVSSATFPVEETCLLSGVTVGESANIADGIRLQPFDVLRDSPLKRMFARRGWESPPGRQRPTAALVCSHEHRKNHGSGAGWSMIIGQERYDEMSDIRLLMTLVGPSSPIIIAHWSTPDGSIPFSESTTGWLSPADEGLVNSARAMTTADIELLRELYGLFKHLNDSDRRRLRIPLDRLNRSLRRVSATDSAIELGIAFESLLLNDLDDERGELTFRLRLRGARFLADTLPERKEVDRLLRGVYQARSVAVHTGQLPERLDGVAVTQLLENGRTLAARTIEKMIRGGTPDWSSVQLG
jgi:Apea-like HEPN